MGTAVRRGQATAGGRRAAGAAVAGLVVGDGDHRSAVSVRDTGRRAVIWPGTATQGGRGSTIGDRCS
jgi:hypothetical protein